MTVVVQLRDRCRICFSLLLRDRSICCQKSYDLFKHIERRKIPINKLNPFQIKIRNQTVCFHDLIIRYLHTKLHQTANLSNFICHDCSTVLLDIEQCAKYLRKTVNQLKIKLNRSNRLRTSSLSATFQKKRHQQTADNHQEPLTILNSDSDEEFDDEEEEEVNTSHDVKSNRFTSSGSDSSSHTPLHATNMKTNNGQCNDDDDDDEDGLIKSSPKKCLQENSGSNGLITPGNTMNLIEGTNPSIIQLHLAHMMAAAASMHPTNTVQSRNDNVMNTLANMQRNFLLQWINDPISTAQAVQAAQAAVSASQTTTNNKQIGSCRKRKSPPEKRVLTNHRSSNNNHSDTSSINENESLDNHHNTIIDHPLELTIKPILSTPVKSTTDTHNIVMNSKVENESPIYHQNYLNQHNTCDEDHKESIISNDSSLSILPSLTRRTTSSKRQKISTKDLLSPNHHHSLTDDTNLNQQKQQRKLDPRTCTDCGKVLFNDKTLLLHRQTHAKNEKQCWICGVNDDDIKKHILNEHGNQKFTDTGFQCQHCEKVFHVYTDLETHTREHTKKKPFECQTCHKRFGQQGNLSCHLRIHSGVKPFTCANCGKAFRHSNSLRRHARTVHSASRGLTMSPGSSMATASSSSSIRLANATTSNSMVSMANDIHRLSTSENFDEGNSGLMIHSDEAESLQGPPSTSSADVPSPNAQIDSDSHEQFGTS